MKHWWLRFRRVTRDGWCPTERDRIVGVGARWCVSNDPTAVWTFIQSAERTAGCINKTAGRLFSSKLTHAIILPGLINNVSSKTTHVAVHPKRKISQPIREKILQSEYSFGQQGLLKLVAKKKKKWLADIIKSLIISSDLIFWVKTVINTWPT